MNTLFYVAKASFRAFLVVLAISAILPVTLCALDLEIIAIIDGDSTAEDMGYNVQSPGDMDGDGFSEIIVGSFGPRSTKVYNGGDPASGTPLTTYDGFPTKALG